MLRLNPNDNQGVRYGLAAYLVEAQRDDDLAALLKEYPDDAMAAWARTSALATFRRSGDSAESRKLLTAALKENPHIRAYLLGERPMPKAMPPFISPGGKDEAVYYVAEFGIGWARTPGAIEWLQRCAPKAKQTKRSSPKKKS